MLLLDFQIIQPTTLLLLAISKGARVIEKHIGLEGQKTGLDIEFSIKGREIKKFKRFN